jgi:hypothetical protein
MAIVGHTAMAENSAQKQPRRGPGRPFEPGRSGNPAGKPRGVRNQATILLEAIQDSDLAAIIIMVVEKAKAGDLAAAKLILDRVLPALKSRAVPLQLHAIGQWGGGDAILAAYRTIIEEVTAGRISPTEGLELVELIEAQRAAVEELRPAAMSPEPTAEQLAEQKREREQFRRIAERMNNML